MSFNNVSTSNNTTPQNQQTRDTLNQLEVLFQQADIQLFKEKNYSKAEKLYRAIFELDPKNIDALNSIAYCIKFSQSDQIENNPQTFEMLEQLYTQALKIDNHDIETNFNIGLLYLQYKQDLQKSLNHFQQCVAHDNNSPNNQTIQDLYSQQFSKAYYNMGMIHDRLGDIAKASTLYKKSIDKIQSDTVSNGKTSSSHYMKAMTNYAVTLEKLGKRQESIKILNQLTQEFSKEIRVFNNLGIIQKRNGEYKEAETLYENALKIDGDSFFPNYNLGVLKASIYCQSNDIQDETIAQQAIIYFEKALQIAKLNKEEVYEINVQTNMALVYEKQGEIASAIKCLEQALAIDKSNQKIMQKIIQLKQLLNQKQQELLRKQDQERQQQELINQKKQELEDQKKKKLQQQEAQQSIEQLQHQYQSQKQPIIIQDQNTSIDKKQTSFQNIQASPSVQNINKQPSNKSLKSNLENSIIQQDLSQDQIKQQLSQLDKQSQRMNSMNQTSGSQQQKLASNMELTLDNRSNIGSRVGDRKQSIAQVIQGIDLNQSSIIQQQNNDDVLVDQKDQEYDDINDQQQHIDIEEQEFQVQLQNRAQSVKIKKKNSQIAQEEQKSMIMQESHNNSQSSLIHKDNQSNFKSEQMQELHLIKNDQSSQDDFMNWSVSECQERLDQDQNNLKARFRLALIKMQQQKYDEAFKNLMVVQGIDPEFMKINVLMKLGEIQYKIDKVEKALDFYAQAEQVILPKQDLYIEIFKAKCYDKLKQFPNAIKCYLLALKLYQIEYMQGQINDAVEGNIQFRLGWSHIRSGDMKGLAHLKKAHSLIPNNTEVILKLAGVMFKEFNETEESLMLVHKAIQLQNDNSDAYVLLGKILDKKDKNKEAIDAFNKAIVLQAEQNQANPPKANTFFYLGQSYEKNKDLKKAILNYKKCLTLESLHFGACIHLANLLANIGEGQRAAKYFKHAIKIDGDSLNAHYGLGKTLQQFSENKEAPIQQYEYVISKDPNYFKAHTQLGILYLDREEYEKAANCLKKSLSINRGYPLSLVTMGNLLFETGHPDEAIKYHKLALTINEKELQALIGLGNAYYDNSNPKDAIMYYKKALEIDDQLSDVHYNLGNALYLIESIDDAIIHYRAAIQLNPKKAESFYNLGNALCVKNEYQAAIQSYHSALELDPRNAPALYNLGNAYYMVNKFEDAVRVYIKALELNEKSPECHFNLASAYNDLGNHQRAVAHYMRSIELDDKNIDAYVCIGGVYENMKLYEKAERYFRMVLEMDSSNVKALESLRKIQKHKQQQQK